MKKHLILSALISATAFASVSHADFLGNFIGSLKGEPVSETVQTPSETIALEETFTEPSVQGKKLSHPAKMRILDKRTNRLEEMTLKTTAPFVFDDLSIVVENCIRHHHQVGHHAAFMTITPEKTKDEDMPLPAFSGWMMSAFPAVAALEHPRYDVRLIECLR